MILLDRQNRVKADVLNTLQQSFDKKFVDVLKRFRIQADLERWKPETEYFRKQADYDTANFYEVYFDGIYVCTFSDSMQTSVIVYFILKNVTRLYEAGEIDLLESRAVEKIEREIAQKKEHKENLKKEAKDNWNKHDKSNLNSEEISIISELVEKGIDDVQPNRRPKKNRL